MEDLDRDALHFVDPTIADFEQNPTSVRILACVATYHGIGYLAWPRDPSELRGVLRKNKDFKTVDDVAHAFKHVATSKRSNRGLKATDVVARPAAAFDSGVLDETVFDSEVGTVTLSQDRGIDLLKSVKSTLAFLKSEGWRLSLEETIRRSSPSPPSRHQ